MSSEQCKCGADCQCNKCDADCKCGAECKCDPCDCCKGTGGCSAGCQCGDNCQCDPCNCGPSCGGRARRKSKCLFSCNGYRINFLGWKIPAECIVGTLFFGLAFGAAVGAGYHLGLKQSGDSQGVPAVPKRRRK